MLLQTIHLAFRNVFVQIRPVLDFVRETIVQIIDVAGNAVIATTSNIKHHQIETSGSIGALIHKVFDVGDDERIDMHRRFGDQTLDDTFGLTQMNQRWFKEHVTHVVRVHFAVRILYGEHRVDLRVTESEI